MFDFSEDVAYHMADGALVLGPTRSRVLSAIFTRADVADETELVRVVLIWRQAT